jgi:GTP cyclohydrolase I
MAPASSTGKHRASDRIRTDKCHRYVSGFFLEKGITLLDRDIYIDEASATGIDHLLELRQRSLSSEQMQRFEGYIGEIFEAFGLNLHTPATEDTPKRFLQALAETTNGYNGDPKLTTIFQAEYRGEQADQPGQVIEGPIPFYALCEHHGLPFFGKAYVGYIPDESILGISKLTRLVRLFAQRFSVQERLGEQIVEVLNTLLAPRGAAVYLEAHHLCVAMRGVRDASPFTRTTAWRGIYTRDAALRSEFLLQTHFDT